MYTYTLVGLILTLVRILDGSIGGTKHYLVLKDAIGITRKEWRNATASLAWWISEIVICTILWPFTVAGALLP